MSEDGTVALVIDTDLFVDSLRNVKKSTEWFNAIVKGERFRIYYSALTEAEVLAGRDCEDNENEEKALVFLSIGRKVLVTNELARLGGTLRRRYGLSLVDAIIAATAIDVKAILCTRNVSDYRRIPGLKVSTPY